MRLVSGWVAQAPQAEAAQQGDRALEVIRATPTATAVWQSPPLAWAEVSVLERVPRRERSAEHAQPGPVSSVQATPVARRSAQRPTPAHSADSQACSAAAWPLWLRAPSKSTTCSQAELREAARLVAARWAVPRCYLACPAGSAELAFPSRGEHTVNREPARGRQEAEWLSPSEQVVGEHSAQ